MANVECNIEQSRNLSNSVPNIDLNDSISSIAPFENNPDLDIYQLIANPDKFDDNDSDNMLISSVSNYYSADKINDVFENFGSRSLSMFHCNIRNLSKNLNLLNEMRYTISKKLDVIYLLLKHALIIIVW